MTETLVWMLGLGITVMISIAIVAFGLASGRRPQ